MCDSCGTIKFQATSNGDNILLSVPVFLQYFPHRFVNLNKTLIIPLLQSSRRNFDIQDSSGGFYCLTHKI